MSDLDEESLRGYFNEMDVDGSGELDKNEVKECLRKAGKFGGEAQLEQLFQACDTDGNGMINFEEFKILMTVPDKEDPLALARCFAAEFLGVMLFQFFGGAVGAGADGNGVVLAVLIYGTAAISGGHLNPAVTFALTITGQIPPLKMIVYWVAQLCGGILGAACYWGLNVNEILGGPSWAGCTLPCGGSGLKVDSSDPSFCQMNGGQVYGIEFIATFLLVFTVFGTAVDPKTGAGNFAPIAIGFSLYAAALSIGPYTGAGLNPARSLCPAIVNDCWVARDPPTGGNYYGDTFQWVYPLAQLCGGGAAGIVYMMVFLNRPDDGAASAAANSFRFMSLETKALKQRLENEKLTEKID
jgi:aquaporin TIP